MLHLRTWVMDLTTPSGIHTLTAEDNAHCIGQQVSSTRDCDTPYTWDQSDRYVSGYYPKRQHPDQFVHWCINMGLEYCLIPQCNCFGVYYLLSWYLYRYVYPHLIVICLPERTLTIDDTFLIYKSRTAFEDNCGHKLVPLGSAIIGLLTIYWTRSRHSQCIWWGDELYLNHCLSNLICILYEFTNIQTLQISCWHQG